jgi:hypothetical protein
MAHVSSESQLDPLQLELCVRGADDWLHMCEVASVVKKHLSLIDPVAIRAASIAAVDGMARINLIVVGDVTQQGFVPWNDHPDAIRQRIESQWVTGTLPEIGDVCWLCNTTVGDQIGKSSGG